MTADDARKEPQIQPFPHSVAEDFPNTIALRSRSPLKLFLLVFGLSVPFGLVGALTRLQLLPGLPVSSLMWVWPGTAASIGAYAASILAYREEQTAGVMELLKRSFDYKRIEYHACLGPRADP